jgi:hypothetical protein
MLQLAENKRARHAQIAKKFRNGYPPFCSVSAALAAARVDVVHTLNAAQIGVLRASMLPWCQRYQPAVSAISLTRAGKR